MLAKRTRRPGSPIWQRQGGYAVIIEDVQPELEKRMGVKTDLEMFLASYAIKNPGTDIDSPEVISFVQTDIESFYGGSPYPDYVFEVYTQQIPVMRAQGT